jgi:lipoprotein signal peptidase
MGTLRKNWFMIFLGAVFVACILAWIVPSWKKELTELVAVAFVGLIAWYIGNQLDRIEGKLDAILKKLNDR